MENCPARKTPVSGSAARQSRWGALVTPGKAAFNAAQGTGDALARERVRPAGAIRKCTGTNELEPWRVIVSWIIMSMLQAGTITVSDGRFDDDS